MRSVRLTSGGAVSEIPSQAGVCEFLASVRDLKAVSGLSLRDLQRRTGLPRSTIASALRRDRTSLPPWDRTRALLLACGVPECDLGAWKQQWTRILRETEQSAAARTERGPALNAGTGQAPDTVAADDDGPAVAEGGGTRVPPRPRRRLLVRGWPPLVTHAVALLLGLAMGGVGAVSLDSGTHAVSYGYPVEEQSCPAAPQDPVETTGPTAASVPVSALAKPEPAWVARPASDAQILPGTDVVLPVVSPVAEGDALVVSVMLTSVCPGPVRVTDTQGDAFRIVGDVTDSLRHRTLLLAAFGVHPLSTADSIHVTYPHASKYHVAVDQFHGISTAVQHAQAHGESGSGAFSTSTVRLDCQRGDLVVTAVGTNSGTAPQLTPEWRVLPVLKLSSYRLSTGFRIAPAAQTCASTGTTTAQWGDVAVIFR